MEIGKPLPSRAAGFVGSSPTKDTKIIARSSNGRTLGPDPSNRGSNPRGWSMFPQTYKYTQQNFNSMGH